MAGYTNGGTVEMTKRNLKSKYTVGNLNITGEAVTTRFWDCCKPSCGWDGKADFLAPVQTCNKDDKPTSKKAGTGCNGGDGYLCSDQHPWAVNDTFSYGFAGVFLKNHPETEAFWCCSCYRLTFNDDNLRNKSMIVQASNTAFDVTSDNRFSLAMPGGNTTSMDGCTRQYELDPQVFGVTGSGVSKAEDCENLPESLRDSCRWRFDWFKDVYNPNVSFERVVCPKELTDITGCVRKDDQTLAAGSTAPSLAPIVLPASSVVAFLAAIVAGLLVV
ncbi:glycoside hydrolase family 45 protein [Aaosphaeria arxii CBS 175.79]|uniref:cellulase n=1 Tax=Aaosphaeria arxii CBS 175.79 TaxID=1450172 RepID=A0A6A5XYI2_9PLEO|nr:glycoside hydrolase family 45 protein [Aaosphaeria arxii CBS 175.79]KAF2017334.1 glycoside hydrolase family 45 protein [Aaosphaeria arxii CBS 175.79]